MKGLILAAGRGSRMAGTTSSRPKCLVELEGRPLVEWQLDAMKAAGVEETGIVTGYRADSLSSVADRRFHNPNWASTNMVETLACASEWLSAHLCIVSYSDIVYEFSAVRSLMSANDADIAITYDPNWLNLWGQRFEDPLSDAETFALGPSGELLEIGGRPSSIEGVEGQYMGLLRISPTGWDVIQSILDGLAESERRTIHMTGLLNQIVQSGSSTVRCLPYEGRWAEVDSESDLEVARRLFRISC